MNNDNRNKNVGNEEDRFSTLDIDGINDLYYQDKKAESPNNNHNRTPNRKPDFMKIAALLASIIVLIFVIYTAIVGILGSSVLITSDGTTETESIESPVTSSIVTTSTLATSATSALISTSTSTSATPTNSFFTTQATVTTAAIEAPPNPAYKDVVIFIDAGHGGKDPGAVSSLNGTNYYEKDINLAVALLLRDELEKKGFTVVMSRDTDVFVQLGDRVNFAQQAEADMFISLHCNSASAAAYGPRIIYTNRDVSYEKERFANYFKTELDKVTDSYPNMRKAFVRSDVEESGYTLAVLCDTKMPSILIEMGFITNTNDLTMLTSEWWQLHAARAFADAIENAYNAGIVKK